MSGHFETHLTVAPAHDDDLIEGWAAVHSAKYTRIVLDRGRAPDQPMLTVRGRGTLEEQRTRAHACVAALRDAGLTVVRVKIEASPFNDGVPQTARDAAAAPQRYFEHHIKLVLAGDAELARVRAISERHDAHVSRNARRALDGGRHERFVTQRCRDAGLPQARGWLDALLAALAADGFNPVEVEQEYVVLDDHPELDAGWIDEGRR
jgi:hypothetical protein